MLTPKFSIEQCQDFVSICINCPYIRSNDVEFTVDDHEFQFYAKPYFLRLQFPGPLIEDGREEARYNVASGQLDIKLPKANPGQHFMDLELISKLMVPPSPMPGVASDRDIKGPLITELPSKECAVRGALIDDGDQEVLIEEETLIDSGDGASLVGKKYGFGNQYSGYFRGLNSMGSLLDIIDPGLDPESLSLCSLEERKEAANLIVDLKFDPEAYLADFMMPEDINSLISWKAWWTAETTEEICISGLVDMMKLSEDTSIDKNGAFKFTDDEREQLAALPVRKIQYFGKLSDGWEQHRLLLLTLLFGFAYNHRTNMGDDNPESVWTISKLCSPLSSFSLPESLEEFLCDSLRRTVSYPLYRSRALFDKCMDDVVVILRAGRVAVVKSLLELSSIFSHHDEAWRLGKVWIDECCVWIQIDERLDSKGLENLSVELEQGIKRFGSEDVEVGGWSLAQLMQDLVTEPKDSNGHTDSESSGSSSGGESSCTSESDSGNSTDSGSESDQNSCISEAESDSGIFDSKDGNGIHTLDTEQDDKSNLFCLIDENNSTKPTKQRTPLIQMLD